jgi:hypothetical protein
MKTTVYFSEFCDQFRTIRPDNFSYQGLRIIFDYLEDYEQSAGDELEMDVIAICCDYSEASWETIAADYEGAVELDKEQDKDIQKQQVIDFLMDEGALIGQTDNSIVYRQF